MKDVFRISAPDPPTIACKEPAGSACEFDRVSKVTQHNTTQRGWGVHTLHTRCCRKTSYTVVMRKTRYFSTSTCSFTALTLPPPAVRTYTGKRRKNGREPREWCEGGSTPSSTGDAPGCERWEQDADLEPTSPAGPLVSQVLHRTRVPVLMKGQEGTHTRGRPWCSTVRQALIKSGGGGRGGGGGDGRGGGGGATSQTSVKGCYCPRRIFKGHYFYLVGL